ncbi:MAG: triosephosphate isomerase [Phycisphaerae bacterium SM23_30]|nr:MAG: triosephosphate isomerase [Phycisphaerae bacterium SM23_30]
MAKLDRSLLIAGNWKMNKTVNEAKELAEELVKGSNIIRASTAVLCPPFTVLGAVASVIESTVYRLGAQNVFWEDSGAFTGEVSPPMLRAVGCQYVIVGHSERRQYFGETDASVNRKIKAALHSGLTPIVCVGETLQEREDGKTHDVIKKQINGVLEGLTDEAVRSLIVAYEPVWAIGTGMTAEPEDADEVHAYIRELVNIAYSPDVSQNLTILYGGSVNESNAETLLYMNNIDGALIGGASLKPESFLQVISTAESIVA